VLCHQRHHRSAVLQTLTEALWNLNSWRLKPISKLALARLPFRACRIIIIRQPARWLVNPGAVGRTITTLEKIGASALSDFL
jgi:hypothetical protein